MKNISTKKLMEELCKREGVNNLVVKPYEEITITTGDSVTTLTGPAVIVINQD